METPCMRSNTRKSRRVKPSMKSTKKKKSGVGNKPNKNMANQKRKPVMDMKKNGR
eukprot:CAMPEP_0172477890 /NCGR_PEP_ID=MMETSP1066-20121228/1441_1 /TAXON_ID=671091 /ORGANISM="Coscinodiscus wailesii, Strain CCMP2513" /LENGTH=54 /DNA_ID=CAMNT_0013236901 /DNA_START=869 /DNA_END=1033 /DNA_ORIENTATION=+